MKDERDISVQFCKECWDLLDTEKEKALIDAKNSKGFGICFVITQSIVFLIVGYALGAM